MPFLRRLHRPTFFTRDEDFFGRALCHARYALIVPLAPNEKRVAEDRREWYWLYVVTHCDTEPRLQAIRELLAREELDGSSGHESDEGHPDSTRRRVNGRPGIGHRDSRRDRVPAPSNRAADRFHP